MKKFLILFVMLFCITLMNVTTLGQRANHLVISEVRYGTTSSVNDEFVELYNPTNASIAVSATTLYLKKIASTGAITGITLTINTASVPAHGFFLIGQTGTTGLPTGGLDATYSTSSALIANGGVFITSTSANTINSNFIDGVTWGTAVQPSGWGEGTNASDPGNDKSIERKARVGSTEATMAASGSDVTNGSSFDSNNNSSDFVVQSTPVLQNSGSSSEVPSSSETQSIGGSTGNNYFIVGDGTNSYQVNINITSSGSGGNTSVTAHTGATSANSSELSGKKIIDLYYTLSSSASGITSTIELDYMKSQYDAISSPVLAEANMFLARRSGTNTYENFSRGAGSSVSSATANGMVQATGATSFSDWFISADNTAPLPVELTSFASSVSDNEVTLKWSTATEVNNYGFEILRSAQNDNWEKIGFVQGNGNSNSPKNYTFTDEPTGGKEFQYRLKQIDFNGVFEYSGITTAVLENVSEFKLDQNYPNPFNPITRISYTLPVRTSVKLRVYDLLAQVIAELVNGIQETGRYEVTFDGSNLPSGAYFYKLEAGSYIEVKKLLLVK